MDNELKQENDEFSKPPQFVDKLDGKMDAENNPAQAETDQVMYTAEDIMGEKVESEPVDRKIDMKSEKMSTDADNGAKPSDDDDLNWHTKTSDKGNVDNVNSVHTEDSDIGSNDVKIDRQNEQSVGENRKRRRKHTRRGSKKNKPRKPRHKFKPYNMLTWEEKRKQGEHDELRAMQRRKDLVLKKGCPIAPYNTTQFLMEEHAVLGNFEEKVISNPIIKSGGYSSGDNSTTDNVRNHNEDTSSTSISDDEYFDKDFNDFYDRVHIDTLNSYSKEDLVNYIYELETKIENLEKFVRTNQGLADQNAKLSEEVQELKGKIGRTI